MYMLFIYLTEVSLIHDVVLVAGYRTVIQLYIRFFSLVGTFFLGGALFKNIFIIVDLQCSVNVCCTVKL